MRMTTSGPTGARARSRLVLGAAVLVLVVTVVACRPVALGSATSKLGNDPINCPQFQPSQAAPCGPQPMMWAAIQGPYESFANGDPYATKCGRNLTVSVSACSSGSGPGGATNTLYDPTGYEYVLEVDEADVGVPVNFEIYDAGAYQRTTGASTPTTTTVTTAAGSTTLNRTGGSNFTANDVGKPITGTGIPAGATVAGYVNSSRITISAPASSSGTNRTVTITTTPDCNSGAPPFNAAPYTGFSWSQQHCQTGDSSSSSPIQVQIFEPDGDGDDATFSYDAPVPGCHLYVAPGAAATTYKNTWATVCTITPTAAGQYPVRIKSSAIVLPDGTPLTDTGSGYNSFALRATGGPTARVYAIGALSIWTNTPATSARFYLAEITSADAGRRLQIDLFDPGDGNSGQYTLQVLAPPSGAPGVVPSSGTVIPAAGYADSCRYNPTASPTRGPDVAAPAGSAAANCQVITKFSSSGSGHYNNSWLSIEIDIAEDYVCETDCWWTVRYDFGAAGSLPTDRTVWAPVLIDKPAPPATTTTTEAPTTTTTEQATTTTSQPVPLGSPTSGPWPTSPAG